MQYVFVIATIILWGLAFFLEKLVVNRMHPGYFQVIAFLTMFILTPAYYLYAKTSNGVIPATTQDVILAVVAFACMNVGTAALTVAYQYGNNAAAITAISNAYIVPMTLCSMLFLHEQLCFKQYVGMVLTFIGTMLLLK